MSVCNAKLSSGYVLFTIIAPKNYFFFAFNDTTKIKLHLYLIVENHIEGMEQKRLTEVSNDLP